MLDSMHASIAFSNDFLLGFFMASINKWTGFEFTDPSFARKAKWLKHYIDGWIVDKR